MSLSDLQHIRVTCSDGTTILTFCRTGLIIDTHVAEPKRNIHVFRLLDATCLILVLGISPSFVWTLLCVKGESHKFIPLEEEDCYPDNQFRCYLQLTFWLHPSFIHTIANVL